MNSSHHLSVFSAFVALTLPSIRAAQESVPGTAATVKGGQIHESERERSLRLTRFVLGDAGFQINREELEESALRDEIDRRLLREEFEKKGGKVKAEYVDEMVKALMARRFNGSEIAFHEALTASELTEEELRTRLIDGVIFEVFRGDSTLYEGDFEHWLKSLRESAKANIVR
ncbi:MAG: SurA N-terminal domain-containing protein [Verrucomicrobiota bacterium]